MSLSISSILYKSPFPAYVYLYFVSPFTLISTTRSSLSYNQIYQVVIISIAKSLNVINNYLYHIMDTIFGIHFSLQNTKCNKIHFLAVFIKISSTKSLSLSSFIAAIIGNINHTFLVCKLIPTDNLSISPNYAKCKVLMSTLLFLCHSVSYESKIINNFLKSSM